jgi:hypothetical protein
MLLPPALRTNPLMVRGPPETYIENQRTPSKGDLFAGPQQKIVSLAEGGLVPPLSVTLESPLPSSYFRFPRAVPEG